jgi:hypothetical protein
MSDPLGIQPALDVLHAGNDRADRRGRGAVWVRTVAVGGAVAAVAVVLLASEGSKGAGPLPPTRPSPSSTGIAFTLSADPFMTDREVDAAFPGGAFARDPSTAPRQLSPCVTDPRGWGAAAQAVVATYRSRTSPTVTLNEYLLRFGDSASAHRAVLAGWAGLETCPEASRGLDPLSTAQGRFDDYAVVKLPHRDKDDRLYELFLVRVGMVVVVIEDTDFAREEGGPPSHFLPVPLRHVVPGYLVGYVPDCVERPEPCQVPAGSG